MTNGLETSFIYGILNVYDIWSEDLYKAVTNNVYGYSMKLNLIVVELLETILGIAYGFSLGVYEWTNIG